jgi:pyruvate/2-oxoglutarate dehydrogenase complex dihydrolipoamide acyltransferase (E2) component
LNTRPETKSLDYADRWFNDGLALCRPPSFHESIEVNMTKMEDLIRDARDRGMRVTYAHIFVRAAALALKAHPTFQAMLCGGKIYNPGRVDIALSVDAGTVLAPVLIVEDAETKSLPAVANEVLEKIPKVQAEHHKMISLLQSWGWIIPSGFLRRRILRLMYRSFSFRRKGSGTFQVSVVSGVDSMATSSFNGCAVLCAGSVRERAIAVDGRVVVCPTAILTCSADHRLWSGRTGQNFLLAVKELLEGDRLQQELTRHGSDAKELSSSMQALS